LEEKYSYIKILKKKLKRVNKKSLRLKALNLRKGYRDLIDLLYATSLTRNLLFLTRNNNLIEFLESIGEEKENSYEENFLKNSLNNLLS